jgi:hypothetical protein
MKVTIAEKAAKQYQLENNNLSLFKSEALSKIEQLEKKVKNTERELDVSARYCKIYEADLIETKKELVVTQL